MVSLTLIKTEAEEQVNRLPKTQRLPLQTALVELCEAHWHALRGPQPAAPLAQILWSTRPLRVDLFIDLYAKGDTRLNNILPGGDLARGLALLVLAEIQNGNESGVQIAHEPMKAFETNSPPAAWLNRVTALLHGTLDAPRLHLRDRHHALWKSLAVIAAHTKRLDLPAVQAVIRLLATLDPSAASGDTALEKLHHDVAEAGIRFVKVDDSLIHYEQHHREHKPVRTREIGELLLEIRRQWLK